MVIVAIESHQGAIDMQVTTIGLDIAKNVFQVHGIDAAEKVVVRKQFRRSQVLEFFKALPPCLIGMEACASAHYWARELTKLGHKVRLMPAARSSSLSIASRARGPRRHERGRQRDLLGPTGRRCGCWPPSNPLRGGRWSSGDRGGR
jgi:hypothetical protein